MNETPEDFINKLDKYANRYIEICLENTKQVVSGSGKVIEVRDRHIPTIAFFLNIWLPKNVGETIGRTSYYNWLKSDNELKMNTIKNIDDKFKALAGDIVANEGKGIFYAKNKLGWTDRADITNTNFNHDITMDISDTKPNEDSL